MDRAATKPATGPQRNADAKTATDCVLNRRLAERDRARMAGSGGAMARHAGLDPDRAAATALARAAEKQARLPIFVEQVEQARMTLPELTETLPERAMLTIVEGSGDGLGVVAICPNLLASLIEMQAMGRVTSRPAPPRRPTRTDAAISADFVNALLAELTQDLPRQDGCPGYDGFRYATFLDDPRPLGLMLDDGVFSRLSIRFRIGAGGQRDGSLMIAVPAMPQANPAATIRTGLPAPITEAPRPATVPLSAAMQAAPIRLVGILCRRKMSLEALRKLAPGTLIPLPQNALDEAMVETAHGQFLARGRLGEANGFHALRLRGPADAAGQTISNAGQDLAGHACSTPPDDCDAPDPFRAAMVDPPPFAINRFAG